MKFTFILIATFFFYVLMLGQSSQTHVSINSFDPKGRKTGYWKEMLGDFKVERYYLGGLKNGIEKTYYRNGSLSAFLKYKEGHPIGLGYTSTRKDTWVIR